MWNLIKNEMFKIVKKKKFKVTTIIIVFLSIFNVFGTYRLWSFNSPQQVIKTCKNQVNHYKEEEKLSKKSIGYSRVKTFKTNAEDELKIAKILKNNNISNREKLKIDINNLKKIAKSEVVQSSDMSVQKKYDEIKLKQYYLDHNLKYNYNKPTAFSILPIYIQCFANIFIIIFISIIAGDIVSNEKDIGTIKMLLTKPASRRKILLSKFLALLLIYIPMILILQVIGFCFIGFVFGFGDPNSPIIVGMKYKKDLKFIKEAGISVSAIAGSGYIEMMWKFALQALLLQVITIISLISFCMLISVLIKNSSIATGISFIFIMFMDMLVIKSVYYSEILPNKLLKIMPWFFTTYIDNPTAIVKGEWSGMLSSTFVTFKFSLIVLTIWAIVCYLISYINFTKKDII